VNRSKLARFIIHIQGGSYAIAEKAVKLEVFIPKNKGISQPFEVGILKLSELFYCLGRNPEKLDSFQSRGLFAQEGSLLLTVITVGVKKNHDSSSFGRRQVLVSERLHV
jgi:hypothetical protein